MATFESVVESITPFVPEAPNPAIRQAFFDAYFEFCKATRYWVGDLYPTKTEVGEPLFYLDNASPGHARIYDVSVLSVDGHPLEAGDFHRAQPLSKRNQRPKYYNFRGQEAITLYPTPDREYTITGELILVPRNGTKIVDDDIYDNFGLGLRHGAIYTLTTMRNKPWSDPQQAAESLGHYTREMENARNLISGRDRKKIRVTSYGGI